MMDRQPTHINKKLKHTIKFWAGILFAQFLLFYILSKFDFIIELNSIFFEIQKKTHQQLFARFNFSFGDILYSICIILTIALLVKLILNRKKKYLVILLIGLNIAYPIYQIFWGFLYFQKPILETSSQDKITEQKLECLAYKFLENCIALRENLNENKEGVFQLESLENTSKAIITAQRYLPANFKAKTPTEVLSIKQSVYSPIMSFTGILGYYNPFTAEAQYNNNIPNTKIPITIAHETAHQLGYAREQEASFIGYLICEKSNNKELQYSANYYALQNLLIAIRNTNENLASTIVGKYSSKMKNDRNYEIKFNEEHKGKLANVFTFTNDLFLKYNQQEGRVTYNYFVNLLVSYENKK